MFSGIVDRIGRISACREVPGGRTLVVHAPGYWGDVRRGASIAVDGVCLTMTRFGADEAEFDVIAESLRRSTLGNLGSGDRVNLQKSLSVGERIDGHFVQGHVDAVATVARTDQSEREFVWWFSMDRDPMTYVVPKGSVAVDGISLTVVDVRETQFSVALIPTTLRDTTLGGKKAGARVNIETDMLARTVVNYLKLMQDPASRGRTGLTAEFLSRHDLA